MQKDIDELIHKHAILSTKLQDQVNELFKLVSEYDKLLEERDAEISELENKLLAYA